MDGMLLETIAALVGVDTTASTTAVAVGSGALEVMTDFGLQAVRASMATRTRNNQVFFMRLNYLSSASLIFRNTTVCTGHTLLTTGTTAQELGSSKYRIHPSYPQ
jgi:hypothetical protein